MPYFINKKKERIRYKSIKGRGPGIIFIHGLNSDMSGQKALSIEKFARKNKMKFIRFECRGHGKSDGKFEDFTISDWKNDLTNLIDNITKGPQIIIGSSMGGWLMMLAAKNINHPPMLLPTSICGPLAILSMISNKSVFQSEMVKSSNFPSDFP